MPEDVLAEGEISENFKNNSPSLQNIHIDKSSSYIKQVNNIPILSEAEEKSLMDKYKNNNDINAGKKIVDAHLRIVVIIAQKFSGYKMPFMDIVSQGNLGLMIALKKFDPTKGARFVTYAAFWITSCIRSYIMSMWSIVKLGTTSSHRASFFNTSEKKKDALPSNFKAIQSDAELVDGGNYDEFSPENEMIKEIDEDMKIKLVSDGMKKLTSRELDIIKMRSIDEPRLTLEDISIKLGISKERVRQIYEAAIKKLRKNIIK